MTNGEDDRHADQPRSREPRPQRRPGLSREAREGERVAHRVGQRHDERRDDDEQHHADAVYPHHYPDIERPAGMSFFGSRNGSGTTVAFAASPNGHATSTDDPSDASSIGTHAYAMFFSSRGDHTAFVT